MEYSFTTFESLLEICNKENKRIYEIMQEKEAFDFDKTVEEVRNKTEKSLKAMKEAIKNGLKSKEK